MPKCDTCNWRTNSDKMMQMHTCEPKEEKKEIKPVKRRKKTLKG